MVGIELGGRREHSAAIVIRAPDGMRWRGDVPPGGWRGGGDASLPGLVLAGGARRYRGGVPAGARPIGLYPLGAPAPLRAVACPLPRGAFAGAILLELQIGGRWVGFDGRRPDLEDKPHRSRARRTSGLVLAHGINPERRGGPPTTLAAVQRHANRIPTTGGLQPWNASSAAVRARHAATIGSHLGGTPVSRPRDRQALPRRRCERPTGGGKEPM
jgi:hypothetical protein